MNRLRREPFVIFQLSVLAVTIAGTLFLIACSNNDNPAASDPACGSGKVTWEDLGAKGGICRDQATNNVVPASCCGK